MRKHHVLTKVLAACVAAVLLPACFGQAQSFSDAAPSAAGAPPNQQGEETKTLPKFGVAIGVGTLGVGIQAGTAVAKHTNLRFGFNFFSYSLSGTDSKSNLQYNGTLRLASAEALVDQYIKGPFHISGGALIYDGFRGTASIRVPGGQTLTLNHIQYYSSQSDPVTGTGTIGSRKVAPEVLFGFGNLLPRSSRHFTATFDIGVAFQGSPQAKLSLLGSTCSSPTTGCSTISSNASVQANITAQQNTINDDLKPFQFYPVIRIAFGYKF
jgi:hypothetical protein